MAGESHIAAWQVNWDDRHQHVAGSPLSSHRPRSWSSWTIRSSSGADPAPGPRGGSAAPRGRPPASSTGCSPPATRHARAFREDRERGRMYAGSGSDASSEIHRVARGVPSSSASRPRSRRPTRVPFPRVAQLTQRTNQFNLTTHATPKRHPAMTADPSVDVLCVKVRDTLRAARPRRASRS